METICNHLGAKLKELVIRLAWCNQFGKDVWIDRFSAEKRGQGISICNIWTVSAPKDPKVLQIGPNPDFEFEYWPATSDTILLNLIRKTVRGKSPCIRINGLPGHHVPNILDVLRNLAADSIFSLATNTKITGSLESLQYCEELMLYNKEPIEDEEVVTMEGLQYLPTLQHIPGQGIPG